MFECKNARGKQGFVLLAVVSLCLVGVGQASPAETTGKSMAEQTIDLLKTPLEKEFGRIKFKSHEKKEMFGTVVGIDFQPVEKKLDSTWGDKIVGILNALGAINAEISARSDSGPTEVRAESLTVGEKEATSVQFVPSSEGDTIGLTLMFPGGLLKR